MRYILLAIFVAIHCIGFGQSFDTLFVHFDINSSVISDSHKEQILGFVQEQNMKGQNKYLIYGLADYLGGQSTNLKLSEKRAQTVSSFLLKSGVHKTDILVVKGLGQSLEQSTDMEAGNSAKRNCMILVPQRNKQPVVKPIVKHESVIPNSKNVAELIRETEVNQTFILGPINFEKSTAQIMPTSLPKLQELLSVMQQNPNLKIIIEGHICCNQLEGSDPNSAPYKLSIARAKVIRDFLVANNINIDRLNYKGFGRTMPINEEEDTPEKQAQNRRVEIRILQK